ncbi:MAG TPA: PH domain-containing protein [Nocardioidaceae bacterium]|nr:PH domain-containing protein [Nocardioidaceae bacterium]
MRPTEVYRSRFSAALALVTIALSVVLLATTLVTSGPEAAARYAGPLGLLALGAWAAYWRPQVEVSDGGLVIRNVWRTTTIPWPAVNEVETRYGLRVHTAYGRFAAWAVPAPAREVRRSGRDVEPHEGAALVVDRWRALRAEGHLDDPRLERPRPDVRVHGATVAAAAALLLLTAAGVLTG